MAQSATYSFRNVSGSFTNPLLSQPIVFAGQIGMGAFHVAMANTRTVHNRAADGTIMPSYVAGNDGTVSIEMQQTSILHQLFLNLYNSLIVAAEGGDPSNWAASGMTLRNPPPLGNQHVLTGISFEKRPDKPYQAQGSNVTWTLMCCDSVETTA
jgi:hypothetical protein